MTLRKRVILILSGVIVFGIAGPAIIFVAQGYSYDFEQNRIVESGTLVVKTEPRGAIVTLGDQEFSTTPLTKRFLLPGDYSIKIEKTGYRPWLGRVSILQGQVSFLPNQAERTYLVLEDLAEIQKIDGVSDVYSQNDSLFLLDSAGTRVYSQAYDGTAPILLASSSSPLLDAKIIDARIINGQGEFLIASKGKNWLVTNGETRQLLGISEVSFGRDAKSIIGINPANELVEMLTPSSTRVLAENTRFFTRTENDLYYFGKTASNQNALFHVRQALEPTLIALVPSFTRGKIIVSPQNQIYLLLDSELYEVGENLIKLLGNVSFATWDSANRMLYFGNDHETWIHDPQTSKPAELLVRSTTTITSPLFHRLTAFSFWLDGQELKALESQAPGQPNIYTLLSASDPKKISINDDGNTISVLDGQVLKILRLR